MDTILYDHHVVVRHECIVGVHPRERVEIQELIFELKLCLFAPLSAQKISTAFTTIIHESTANNFKLLESMAYELHEQLVKAIDSLSYLCLIIKKPSAIENALCSYVKIYQSFNKHEIT